MKKTIKKKTKKDVLRKIGSWLWQFFLVVGFTIVILFMGIATIHAVNYIASESYGVHLTACGSFGNYDDRYVVVTALNGWEVYKEVVGVIESQDRTGIVCVEKIELIK